MKMLMVLGFVMFSACSCSVGVSSEPQRNEPERYKRHPYFDAVAVFEDTHTGVMCYRVSGGISCLKVRP